MSRSILTVGLVLASDDIEDADFDSKTSLLDWDIVLFRPDISGVVDLSEEEFQGKPCLRDGDSFRLKEYCQHWRRELKEAVENGKTVIVFLSELEEFYVYTGSQQFSGTGRNQKTTNIVGGYSNYESLPIPILPVASSGSAIRLASSGAEPVAVYWSQFGAQSRYEVVITATDLHPCLVTITGSKTVGALIRSKGSSGSLVLLPNIDFESDEFTTEAGEWTDVARQFAQRLIAGVVSLDSALRLSSEVMPEPDWAAAKEFSLATEHTLRAELLDAERILEEAQRRKEEVTEKLQEAGDLRRLLFEKGKPLENAIVTALRILGFSAIQFREGGSEFDVVFQSDEGRFIGEAEGKDSKPINVEKLRQLSMNIHEDLQREDVTNPAKPVVFGNAFRLEPPQTRQDPFTAKCHSAAATTSTALVATQDLFRVAQYLTANADIEFASQCRKVMLATIGRVEFPKMPDHRYSISELKEAVR